MIAVISLATIVIMFLLLGTQSIALAIAATASAVIHGLRMRHYHTRKTFNDPMLWILHAGYAWVIVALICIAVAALGFWPFSAALHAMTAGAIGSMTLGMMCRVSLGHTGRNLVASKATTGSFALMQCAAIMRVFGPIISPDHNTEWIIGSASLWTICFVIYVWIYAPMLWKPRPDGRAA